MRRRALWLLPFLATPATAQGIPPAVRPHALVDGDVIVLGDLFDQAGPRADAVIGSAPAAGRRLVLDASQLLTIARRHGLAWRPMSDSERVVVERPGRAIPMSDIEDLIRTDLVRLGMEQDSEIDIPGFVPPMVPISVMPQVIIEAPNYEPISKRFAVTLVINGEGMGSLRTRLTGRVLATANIIVATRRIAAGQIVDADDVEQKRVRVERVRQGTAQEIEDVVGRQLRRQIGPDIPFMTADLRTPYMVTKNQSVIMVLDSPGLAVTVQGRAMDSASRGQTVRVMNQASRSIVEAEAIAPGRVRVLPGAVPVVISRRN